VTRAAVPRVRVEPHGPGRLLVLVTRTQQRAFQLSHAEAAWLSGELARYLAGLPGEDAAALVAVLAAELADVLGSAALSGPVRAVAAASTRERPAPSARNGRAGQAAPGVRFVPPSAGA
jgi:hypothetical protein